MHRDYRLAIDALTEDIEALKEQLAETRTIFSWPDTPTPIPFPTVKGTAAPAAGSELQPPTDLLDPTPPPMWAMVAKRGNKRNTNTTARPTQVPSRPTNQARPAQQKKGPTARERRLFIKREGGPISTTMLQLRDDINQALAGTYVKTLSLKGDMVTLTTMELIRTTMLNSKIGSFLHLIPGTTSVHLDTPVTQILVHGIPTSQPLATIAMELTTFNPGLALMTQPRWLTTEAARVGKTASSVVIAITGLKAPEFVGRRLAAVSTTYRSQRRLRFDSSTQCAKCHGFGHHNNKCMAPATCWWCALLHPTGEHTCPTATCRMRSRPCNHSILRYENCNDPQDAHHLLCPS